VFSRIIQPEVSEMQQLFATSSKAAYCSILQAKHVHKDFSQTLKPYYMPRTCPVAGL
jgi:hypothetical protein